VEDPCTYVPNLARMAREYLALFTSSAGEEGIFSPAGKTNCSFRKNVKEDNMQVQLTVYQNP